MRSKTSQETDMSFLTISEILHNIKKERQNTKQNDRYSITMRMRKREEDFKKALTNQKRTCNQSCRIGHNLYFANSNYSRNLLECGHVCGYLLRLLSAIGKDNFNGIAFLARKFISNEL